MRIGFVDVDGHNFPNLPIMKLSAYHKKQGDTVEWANGFENYDRVYMAKVFTFTPDDNQAYQTDELIKGGTGYGIDNKLPAQAENFFPIIVCIRNSTKHTVFLREVVRVAVYFVL